jgi:hypothetical protein
MYVISLTENNRVLDVYNPEIYIDEGVVVFPITDEEFQMIFESGNHGIWLYENEKIVQVMELPIELLPTPTPPSGTISVEIL